jgi:hypothetical protein
VLPAVDGAEFVAELKVGAGPELVREGAGGGKSNFKGGGACGTSGAFALGSAGANGATFDHQPAM